MTDLDSLFSLDRRAPPALCAEMSGNHKGDPAIATQFVHSAKAAGADLLKVQVYRPDTITFKSDLPDFRLAGDNDWAAYGTLYSLYEKAHTPWDWIAQMFDAAADVDLPVFASPFDPTAVAFLEELGCPIYKIASPEITDLGLIEACAATGKPIIMSTGLASKQDLDDAVDVVHAAGAPLMILKCVSAYPTPIDDVNAATIPWLRETYNCAAGLSDHTLGMEAGFAAAALGAAMIEKHFKMPGDTTSVDAEFSLGLDEMPRYKESLHAVSQAVGKVTLDLPEISKPSLSGRRSLYIVADVAKGEPLTERNVRSIRPSYGMAPKHLRAILGRPAARDLKAGERMTWDAVEGDEQESQQ